MTTPLKSFVTVRSPRTCVYDRIRTTWRLNLEELDAIQKGWEPPLWWELHREAEHEEDDVVRRSMLNRQTSSPSSPQL